MVCLFVWIFMNEIFVLFGMAENRERGRGRERERDLDCCVVMMVEKRRRWEGTRCGNGRK